MAVNLRSTPKKSKNADEQNAPNHSVAWWPALSDVDPSPSHLAPWHFIPIDAIDPRNTTITRL